MAQISMADVLVWLDDVQFITQSFTRRVQVINNGKTKFISIPRIEGGKFKDINSLRSIDNKWKNDHRNAFLNSFSTRFFKNEAVEIFDEAVKSDLLIENLIARTEVMATAIKTIPSRIIRSSELGICSVGSNRILDIVKTLGGTQYLTGHGAAQYLDHRNFEMNGISVRYMKYEPVPWKQPLDFFTPSVSTLDLISTVSSASVKNHLNPLSQDWRSHLNGNKGGS